MKVVRMGIHHTQWKTSVVNVCLVCYTTDRFILKYNLNTELDESSHFTASMPHGNIFSLANVILKCSKIKN